MDFSQTLFLHIETYGFVNIEKFLYHMINPTWSYCMVLLMCCWIRFATVLLRIFCLCSSVIMTYNFLFWWYLWFWYHGDSGLIEWVWNRFRRIGIDSSLNTWQNLPVKSSGPGLLFTCMLLFTPGFLFLHQLPELGQTHVHRVSDAIQPSHPLSFPSPPTFNLSQHQGFF